MRTRFFIFLQAFILGLLIIPFRGYSFLLSSFVGFFIFYTYTWFAVYHYGKKIPHWQILFLVIAGMGILEIPFRCISFTSTMGSFPDFILRMAGLLLGYFSCGKNLAFILPTFILSLGGNLFMSTNLFSPMNGWEIWLHKMNTGRYLPYVDRQTLSTDFWKDARNLKGESLDSVAQGKVVFIDFWTRSCGHCWKKLPEVQSLYNKYKDNPSVEVCTVYTLYQDDKDAASAQALIEKKGYTFPVYYIGNNSKILKELNISAFPRTIMLNKKGEIILDNPTSSMIEKEIEYWLREK